MHNHVQGAQYAASTNITPLRSPRGATGLDDNTAFDCDDTIGSRLGLLQLATFLRKILSESLTTQRTIPPASHPETV